MKQNENGVLLLPDGSSKFPNGSYNITYYAKDYFYQDTTKNFWFKVDVPIDPVDHSKVLAYPNPTTGITTVVYPQGKNAVLRLYDTSGKTLKQIIDNDQDGQTQVDLTNRPSGLVLYNAILNDNSSSRESYGGKIIKE